MEIKSFEFARSGFTSAEKGQFTAIVSAYGVVDSYGERVKLGAFDATLKRYADSGRQFKVLWSHNIERPIGTATLESLQPFDERLPEEIRANGGLMATGQLALDGVPDAQMALAAMRQGIIDEWSIGFMVPPNGRTMADDGIVDITECNLFEVSPVVIGANRQTGTMDMKSGGSGIVESTYKVISAIEDLMDHIERHKEMKLNSKAGKVFSAANMAALKALAGALKKAIKQLMSLLSISDSAEKSGTPAKDVRKVVLRALLKDKGVIN